MHNSFVCWVHMYKVSSIDWISYGALAWIQSSSSDLFWIMSCIYFLLIVVMPVPLLSLSIFLAGTGLTLCPFFFMFFCPGCWYYSMTCSLLLCWLNSIISLYSITHNSTPHQIVKWRYICVHECTRLKASLFDERWLTGGLTRQGRDWTLLAPFPALNKQTTTEEKRRGWVGWRFKWFYSMLLYNSFLPLRYSSMAFLYKRRRCPRKQKRFHSLVCSLSCFLLTCLILHTISLLLPLLLFN